MPACHAPAWALYRASSLFLAQDLITHYMSRMARVLALRQPVRTSAAVCRTARALYTPGVDSRGGEGLIRFGNLAYQSCPAPTWVSASGSPLRSTSAWRRWKEERPCRRPEARAAAHRARDGVAQGGG